MSTTTGRFERQERLFGVEGQQKLSRLDVAVVGAGGLGSHIVQQLGFLGVGHICVIDPDIITLSSLNRVIGARHDDPRKKTPKVEVARRLVESIDPALRVSFVFDSVISCAGFQSVKSADFVFGCLDNDGPRLVLMELCQAYQRPFFDLATEVPSDSLNDFGGRVCFSVGGNGCLLCLGLLSTSEAQQFFLSATEKKDRDTLYGVSKDELRDSGPSVVTLNGVVASIAASEFLVQSLGLRGARRLLIYRGRDGKVTVSQDQPTPDCYYCKAVYGLKEKAGVERYLER